MGLRYFLILIVLKGYQNEKLIQENLQFYPQFLSTLYVLVVLIHFSLSQAIKTSMYSPVFFLYNACSMALWAFIAHHLVK